MIRGDSFTTRIVPVCYIFVVVVGPLVSYAQQSWVMLLALISSLVSPESAPPAGASTVGLYALDVLGAVFMLALNIITCVATLRIVCCVPNPEHQYDQIWGMMRCLTLISMPLVVLEIPVGTYQVQDQVYTNHLLLSMLTVIHSSYYS